MMGLSEQVTIEEEVLNKWETLKGILLSLNSVLVAILEEWIAPCS